MKRGRHVLSAIAIAGVSVAAIATPSGASAPRAHAAACVKATNIEAIVDDSGSMAITDSGTLRVKAMKLLINTLSPGTYARRGRVRRRLLRKQRRRPPTPFSRRSRSGQTRPRCAPRWKARSMADNGATDYNGAFAQSDADNPNAQARIFLTDGGHDVGTYNKAT